jgi:AraC family transcriptional regulator of adaptative response/methylated-DNA-[protein]-cysteine methyltransferase
VKTTGVFCRPSCGARLARRENVAFHTSTEDAVAAGFRPCKRCKPDRPSLAERNADMVTQACRLIERSEVPLCLDQLAQQFAASPYHFHRVFKSITGLTPRQYAAADRAQRVRNHLGQTATVTDAIYNAGYNANSRFYERSDDVLGMTPTEYRAGGSNTAIRFAVGECSLGSILVARSQRGIVAIRLGDDPETLAHELQDQFPLAEFIGGDAEFEALVARVVGFIEEPSLGLDLPLDVRGTAFQQRVWQALCEIPVGETASYSDVAARIGAPKSTRAVARACAANGLAVAIPCHRVVRSDGQLSGYRWGVHRKKRLLEQESAE